MTINPKDPPPQWVNFEELLATSDGAIFSSLSTDFD